jgi:hypothetical protein
MEVIMSMVYLNDETLDQVVGGLVVTAEVGINSPKDSKFVEAPPAANGGVLNAFQKVLANTGGVSNIAITTDPPLF